MFLTFRARVWVGNNRFIERCHFEHRVGNRKKSSAAVEICCPGLQKVPSTCRCPRDSPLSECVSASATFHLQKKEHACIPFAAGLGLGQPDHFVSLFGRTPAPARRCALISAILQQNHRGSRPLARRFGKNILATHRDPNISGRLAAAFNSRARALISTPRDQHHGPGFHTLRANSKKKGPL